MKKWFFVVMGSIFILMSVRSYAQDKAQERPVDAQGAAGVFVLRQAKEFRNKSVAVEGYLIGEIFEIKVEARIAREKPRIANVTLIGPRLGRQSYQTRETILAGIGEDMPIETTQEQGLLRVLSPRKKTKKLEGAVTKELFKIRVPAEKIVKGKRYWLWVDVESTTEGGQTEKFRFELEDFPALLMQAVDDSQ